METFDYAAVNGAGQRKTGSLSAESARDARDILRGRSLTLVDIKPARGSRKAQQKPRAKTRHKDLTQATRQLAILIDASTSVEEALKVTALQFERSAMREVLLDIRARVLEGAKLSDGFAAHPRSFDSLYVAMVASGEASGRLAPVLERLAVDLEAAQKIRRKILAATVYPIVLSVVALLVVAGLMIFIVPKVVTQFSSFGQELPVLTRFVIGLSDWLRDFGLIAIGVIALLIFGFKRALRAPTARYKYDAFVLRLPLIGGLSRNLNAARFSRTIAGLIASGTPSLAAMETARHTLRNVVMRDAVGQAALRVREGSSISNALKQSRVFPPLVTQMVAGGETGGDVGIMFSKSADYLESEFESATAVFLSLLEPLIIIALALIVLLIFAAIFLPIMQLNTLVG